MSKGLISQEQMDQQRGGTLRKWLEKPEIMQDLSSTVNGWMTVNAFKTQILVDIQDEKIAHCTPESKFAAVLKCATLQLLPSLQQVALVPRAKKDNNGNILYHEVHVMPQWQGYQSMMLRHPDVKEVRAVVVHKTDKYHYNTGTGRLDSHDYDPFDEKRIFRSLEDIRGGYLVIFFRDDRPPLWHFVTQDTIKKARNCAETLKVWDKWPYEMTLKTLFRNAYNRRIVPMDPMLERRFQTINQEDDEFLGNDPSRLAITFEQGTTIVHSPGEQVEPETPDPALSRAEQVAAKFAPKEPDVAQDDASATEATDQSPEDTKPPKGKGKAKQKSLISDPETEKTRYQKLVEKLKSASDAEGLSITIEEAGSWCAEKEITTAEYEELVKQANLLNAEM